MLLLFFLSSLFSPLLSIHLCALHLPRLHPSLSLYSLSSSIVIVVVYQFFIIFLLIASCTTSYNSTTIEAPRYNSKCICLLYLCVHSVLGWVVDTIILISKLPCALEWTKMHAKLHRHTHTAHANIKPATF